MAPYVHAASCHPLGRKCITTAHWLSSSDVSVSFAISLVLMLVISVGWNGLPSYFAIVWSNSFTTRHYMQKLARMGSKTRFHLLEFSTTPIKGVHLTFVIQYLLWPYMGVHWAQKRHHLSGLTWFRLTDEHEGSHPAVPNDPQGMEEGGYEGFRPRG